MEKPLDQAGNITLRQLGTFLELARAGAFGAAAARLGIGQPGLSRNLRQLEDELGVTLVRRHSKGLILTDKGVKLRGLTDAFFEALESLPNSDVKVRRGSPLVIGIPESIGSLIIPSVFKAMKAREPEFNGVFVEQSSPDLVQAMEDGRLDLILSYDPPKVETITTTPLLDEDLLVIAPPSWDWSGQRGPITVRDLATLPTVLLKSDHSDRRRLAEAERQQGIRLEPVIEVGSLSVVKSLVNRGVGFSVSGALGVSSEIASGSLQSRPLGSPPLKTRLCMSVPTENASSATMVDLSILVADSVRSYAENRPNIRTISKFGIVLGA